jgi:chemotaxis protein MotB
MIRRKPIDDEDENPDRWLVSYADFITLLFAFFVVMYAVSSVNLSKYTALTNSMGTAFSGNGAPNQQVKLIESKQNDDKSIIKPLPLSYLYQEKTKREHESMSKLGHEISDALAPMVVDGKIRVVQNNRGIRIDINDSLLFTSGSAELAPTAQQLIDQVIPIIKATTRLIQVEGHTDLTPIHNEFFYSNWELSAVRATTVVRMLNERGIDEKRLSAVGFGATQPLSSSDTAYALAKNRRVSIMILYESNLEEHQTLEIKPNLSASVIQNAG